MSGARLGRWALIMGGVKPRSALAPPTTAQPPLPCPACARAAPTFPYFRPSLASWLPLPTFGARRGQRGAQPATCERAVGFSHVGIFSLQLTLQGSEHPLQPVVAPPTPLRAC
jgi:hypothetical protein